MTARLHGLQACVFDAYGTLFDFNSAVAVCDRVPAEKTAKLSDVWRQKQLQYTWLRSLMRQHADFWQVTGEALDYALAATDIADREVRERLMLLYRELAPFPEVRDVLQELRAAGMKTAILSNGTPGMLADVVDAAGIGHLLDHTLSVEEVGVYKPDPRVYQLAVDRLGVPAAQISFQSSNSWDAVGAKAFGCQVVWVNRYGQPRERLGFAPDVELDSLLPLPAMLGLTSEAKG